MPYEKHVHLKFYVRKLILLLFLSTASLSNPASFSVIFMIFWGTINPQQIMTITHPSWHEQSIYKTANFKTRFPQTGLWIMSFREISIKHEWTSLSSLIRSHNNKLFNQPKTFHKSWIIRSQTWLKILQPILKKRI